LFTFSIALEEKYASELLQLNEMGFANTQENIRVLQSTNGKVDLAIEVFFS
jgi:hypothetical protein